MTENREGMLDKIRALLSKTIANGCTEAEELAALAKGRALMDAYEVTEVDLQLAKEEGVILRREKPGTKDPHGIKFNVSRAVSEFCDCTCWRSREGGLVFLGLASDVQFATWLLDHLTGFVLTELANHLMGDVAVNVQRRKVINGFVDGITGRISERLDELCEPQAPASANSRALVVTKQGMIKAKMKELDIKLSSCSGSSRQHDTGSFNAGQAAGNRASFGRPVSGRASTPRIGSSK
jgi:Protein of unknown function (DUF2786)